MLTKKTPRTGARSSSPPPPSASPSPPAPSSPSPTSSSQPSVTAQPQPATGEPFPGGSGQRCHRWHHRHGGEEHLRQPRNRPWLLAPAARTPPQEAPVASPGVEASVAVARRSSRPPLPPLPWAARFGATLQPGPYGATAAHDASASAAVPPSVALQHQQWAAR